jgi:hypothetical protein
MQHASGEEKKVVGKPDGKKPTRKWDDNIKMDHK